MSPKSVRLRVFGGLRLETPEGVVLEGSAQRRRLALLALAAAAGPAGISRDKVLAFLWPESEAERARHALAQLVYSIRQQFNRTPLLTGTTELRLEPAGVTSDLGDFRAAHARGELEQAAALHTGPFLDGFFLSDAPEFERWVESERASLAAEVAGILETLARRALTSGQADVAVGYWRRLTTSDPLNARFALGLMDALEAQGDRAGALQHARLHSTLVRRELEMAPDPAIVQAALRLQREVAGGGRVAGKDAGWEAAAVELTAAPIAEPAPRELRLPIRWRVAAAVTAVVAIVALLSFPHPTPRLDRKRVLVATFENRTGDPSLAGVGAMAADWITEGVAQTGLVPIVDARTAHLAQTRVPGTSVNNDSSGRIRSLAEETGAGTVVWGSYYRVGDSLVFQARISDANRGEIRRVLDPVRGPLADPTRAVDLLRDRAMGALATLFNYRESDWIAQSGTPPRYEAYQAFMEGTDLAVQFKEKEALARFARARELDSTFAQPVLWTAESYIVLQDWAHADSFLSLAQARRERYSPFDRAFLTNLQAELDGEWEAALRAAEEMARLAPGSEASVVVGQEAEALNRPREAIRAFRSVDPDRGWLRGWSGYWGWAMYAYHEVGLDREALALAQQARTRYPNLEDGLLYEIVALSAPGAEREIVADLDLAMTLPTTDNFGPVETFGFAIMELRAHGHPDLAYRVTQKAASWLRASNRTEVAGSPVGLARLYALCGEPDQARAILEKAARATPADVEIEGSLGVLAESRGDRAEADRIAAVLAGDTRRYLYGKPYFWRARMAAARGDKEAAVQLLREAFAHGYRYSWAFHLTPEFQGLRDYPPFEDIARAKG